VIPSTPPELSVVIPSHQTRELTLACLASLERGGGVEREVLVVDDASTDGTAEAVEQRFPAVRVLRQAGPQGFSRSANHGLAAARGEILWLLNADTEVDAGSMDRLASAFAADLGLGVAGATLRYPDGRPQWSAGTAPTWLWLAAMASGVAGGLPRWRRQRRPGSPTHPAWVTGAAMAIRRKTWLTVGPLEERFAFYAQDLDFCLRAREAGFGIALLPEVAVMHHHGAAIGQRSEATTDRAHLAHLWSDLALWADLRRPRWWALGARLALLGGAGVRLANAALRELAGRHGATRDRAAARAGLLALLGLDASQALLAIHPAAPRAPRP
jgi:GT2 family glycosyltransferase